MTTIMIIEDEKDLRLTIKEILESEGYHVLSAGNGSEAMEILKSSVIPDLILLDMNMPIMNGWDFAKAFMTKYGPISPILVLTAAADARQRAEDIHAIDYIEKPFKLEWLLDKIKQHT